MSEYDDTIQIKASEVKVGDVLLSGETVESVRLITPRQGAHFVAIKLDSVATLTALPDALVAVREVVTD